MVDRGDTSSSSTVQGRCTAGSRAMYGSSATEHSTGKRRPSHRQQVQQQMRGTQEGTKQRYPAQVSTHALHVDWR